MSMNVTNNSSLVAMVQNQVSPFTLFANKIGIVKNGGIFVLEMVGQLAETIGILRGGASVANIALRVLSSASPQLAGIAPKEDDFSTYMKSQVKLGGIGLGLIIFGAGSQGLATYISNTNIYGSVTALLDDVGENMDARTKLKEQKEKIAEDLDMAAKGFRRI